MSSMTTCARHRRFLVVLAAALFWVPAQAQQRPKVLTYVKPAGRASLPIDLTVALPPDKVLERIRSNLKRAGLSLVATTTSGVVAATYSGKATPWIDCGWIFSFEQGQRASPKRVGGAAERATIAVRRGDQTLQLERRVTLDGFLAVQVEPVGNNNTRVTGHATYVVTRSLSAENGEDEQRMIDFRSGETGSFEKGTTCLPTGQFERLVIQGLPKAP
ncbi:MAG TPA: hypothetical protein VHL31_14835 [Geminicoccus sp.]|jgi:hypothetical protein|uniref:hypothetical protein n=1 Tax=Geminicoccus sp. TaxID=2024832 RepID=UPI002E343A57|nr:hypothetical protein [Geminicoccus sp.]HEX2527557.1 hypothetical protein [Geminicoccus sp.]